MMHVKLMVVDREEAYLFLDPENAHPDAAPFEFFNPEGIPSSEWESDDCFWRMSNNGNRLFLSREIGSMINDVPIPAPIICVDVNDYDAQLEEMNAAV